MSFEVEIREQEGREPTLRGVIIQEGRAAAGGRAELFAPGSIVWPSEGMGIAAVHHGKVETRGQVIRQPDGRLTVTARATEAIQKAFEDGKRFLSVEFVPIDERRTSAGVREIVRAYVDRAALVHRPEYAQAVAEVREPLTTGVTGGPKREEVLRWL